MTLKIERPEVSPADINVVIRFSHRTAEYQKIAFKILGNAGATRNARQFAILDERAFAFVTKFKEK